MPGRRRSRPSGHVVLSRLDPAFTQHGDPLAMSRESFREFCQFITGRLGIKMSEAKIPLLRSRLQRRLHVLHIGTLNEYRQFLFSPAGESERTHFINAVTTNKTDFFREPLHFQILTQQALTELDPESATSGRPRNRWDFRLWCAGCSTGEEPYSLAMTLAEHALVRPGFDFAILATDISTRVLDHARAAIYGMERIDPVSEPLRKKYLLRSKDPARAQVRIVPALRQHIAFRQLNFMDESYDVKEMFDVIFFRNVMIYFDKATQEAVVNKLCRNLVPGGYMFVGLSESLAGLDIPLEPAGQAVFRRV